MDSGPSPRSALARRLRRFRTFPPSPCNRENPVACHTSLAIIPVRRREYLRRENPTQGRGWITVTPLETEAEKSGKNRKAAVHPFEAAIDLLCSAHVSQNVHRPSLYGVRK